jgi:hypothetical protein
MAPAVADLEGGAKSKAYYQLIRFPRQQCKESLMSGLDAATFDAKDLIPQGDMDNRRVWKTAAGDMVTLYYFSKAQPFRATADELASIRAGSRRQASQYGGAIVEVELCAIGGLAEVREILKVPQKPTGMGYLGSLMIPLANTGYMVAVACPERGITGMRDMAIFAQLLDAGDVEFADGAQQPTNWMGDPYDPSITDPPARNRADDEKYDSLFPDHPLSRVRGLLRQIGNSFGISDQAKPG